MQNDRTLAQMTFKRAALLLGLCAAHAAFAQPGMPVSMTTVQGVRESGNLLSLAAPDGIRYSIRTSAGSTGFAEAIYTARNDLFRLGTAMWINLYIKMERSSRGGFSVDVYNWSRRAWETKDIRYDITSLDSYYRLAGGREFFSPDGVVRVRFRTRDSRPTRLHFDALWIVASP